MWNIVCAIYHDCNREVRSREVLTCCMKMGMVHYVSFAAPKNLPEIDCRLVDKNNPLALFNFLKLTKKAIREVEPELVLLHDNDCSVLVPFIRKHFPETKIIYDSSELFIPMNGEAKHCRDKTESYMLYLKQQLTFFRRKYEKKHLKDADVVLCANVERAQITQEYFGLRELPLVFDNIHRIDDEFDCEACEKKFSSYFADDAFNILFAGGIGAERHTYEYIRAVSRVKIPCRLIIAGSASETAVAQYEQLVQKLKMDNVFYVGMLTRAELRYCMQKSQGSVVVFDKNSYNTIYCASGKCYESLFEGVPILASENPPLKRLCQEEGLGVSNDDFAAGIETLQKDYAYYVKNVIQYTEGLEYERRIDVLCESVKRKLKS